MKPILIRLIGILLTLLALSAQAYELTWEQRMATTNRAKFGYFPFVTNCPPVVPRFRVSTALADGSYTGGGPNCSMCGLDEIEVKELHTSTYSEQKSPPLTETNYCSGSSYYDRKDYCEWNGELYAAWYEYDFKYLTNDPPCTWLTESNFVHNSELGEADFLTTGGSITETVVPAFKWRGYSYDGPGYEQGCDGTENTTITSIYTLSAEYTTPMLLDALTLQYGDWLPFESESRHAAVFISEEEWAASLTGVQARLRINGRQGERWEAEYYEWRTRTNVTFCVATNLISGVCKGGEEVVEVPLPVAYRTESSGDCVRHYGEEAWITIGGCQSSGCALGDCGPGWLDGTLDSVNVRFGLGAVDHEGRGAALQILAQTPSPALGSPEALRLKGSFPAEKVDVVQSGSGAVRQVLTPECLADIVTLNTTSYQIRLYSTQNQAFYRDPSQLYDVSSLTAFLTNTVELVGSTNHLRVTGVTMGITKQFDYAWSDVDGWTLTSGGGLRQENVVWSESTLTKTRKVRDALGIIVSEETSAFVSLPGAGQVLSTKILGSGASAKTNSCYYFENASTDGTNYGRLHMEVDSTGHWKRYEYDANGRLVGEIRPFGNAATNAADSSCRVAERYYTNLLAGSLRSLTVIEKLLGHEIHRRYELDLPGEHRLIECPAPGLAWSNTQNLVTITRFTDPPGAERRVASVKRPDGTMDIYSYDEAQGNLQTAVATGEPDEWGTNIVRGTRTVTLVGPAGKPLSRVVSSIDPDVVMIAEFYTYSGDPWQRSYTKKDAGENVLEVVQHGCCGLELTQGRDGTTTYYHHDGLGRQVAQTTAGVTASNMLDAASRVIGEVLIGTNGQTRVMSRSVYNTAGTLLFQTNALQGVTSWGEQFNASGERVFSVTGPEGGVRTETLFKDGSLKSVSGTGASPLTMEYGAELVDGMMLSYSKEARSATEWTKSHISFLGKPCRTLYSDGALTTQSHNSSGQLSSTQDADGVRRLYQYNSLGEVEYTAVDMNRNGVIDFGGTDRITRTLREVAWDSTASAYVVRASTHVHAKNGEDTSTLTSSHAVSLDGLRSWTSVLKDGSPVTTFREIVMQGGGLRQERLVAPDNSRTTNQYRDGFLISTGRYDSQDAFLSGETYAPDVFGQRHTATDSRTGATTYSYNAAGLIETVTTPAPEAGVAPQVTTTFYDKSLRPWRTVLPDGVSVTNHYDMAGNKSMESGARVYPSGYGYDAQGRLASLTNWAAYPSQGERVTRWNYDTYRGWLAGKRYPDNTGPDYAYSPGGRMTNRAWARSIHTSYTFGNAGDAQGLNYSDTTPDVGYVADRLGRTVQITQGDATVIRTHDVAGKLLSESYSGGPLDGLTVTNEFDGLLRRTRVSLLSGSGAALASVGYSYGEGSRLDALSVGANTVIYGYLANSDLISEVEFKNNDELRMTTSKQWDKLNRLKSIATTDSGAALLTSFSYGYNAANQRTNVVLGDSRWVWGYDRLGQVASGVKRWNDGTLVAGQQFGYRFDEIGNRLWTTNNGHLSGYTNNSLNQIAGRGVPGWAGVVGEAHSNATVTLWGDNGAWACTSRKGKYFAGELAVTNTTGPVWLTITNYAALQDGSNPDYVVAETGRALVPGASAQFQYDADGNLTEDGLWIYYWDGENRLIAMESSWSLPDDARKGFDFRYDHQGRRIEKAVYSWDSQEWNYILEYTHRFVYDGWNLIAVLDENNAPVLSFAWGTDISGTMQGAGGVGGLLSVTVHSGANAGTYFYCYDGNGNVVALVSAADGTVAARYEYGPFGELLRATGPMAKANPFLFSTKYYDWETGLYYYGYRYYDPNTGRWPNRDPIGELGGANLYGFVRNNAISRFDPFGLKDYKKGTDDPAITPDPGAGTWDSEEWTLGSWSLKQLIVNNIGIVWIGMPDAVNHVQHYFGNSGSDYTIRLQKMIDDVPSAKRVFNTELGLAQAFVESLPDGKHPLTSGSASGGYNGKSESQNWYYAVGGYSAWGKGNATVCKDEYTLEFQYKFYDRYNWDTGKSVTILGQTVTDQFMGDFHRQGLAREFDMRGAVKKTVKWKKGQAPKVTEGWESEQGR